MALHCYMESNVLKHNSYFALMLGFKVTSRTFTLFLAKLQKEGLLKLIDKLLSAMTFLRKFPKCAIAKYPKRHFKS